MGDAQKPSTHIGRMNLRIPVPNAAAGQRVAQNVAVFLEQGLPEAGRPLGALNIRLSVPTGATESEIGVAIAEAIRKALIRNGR
jgi:hypothetical protein